MQGIVLDKLCLTAPHRHRVRVRECALVRGYSAGVVAWRLSSPKTRGDSKKHYVFGIMQLLITPQRKESTTSCLVPEPGYNLNEYKWINSTKCQSIVPHRVRRHWRLSY